MTPIIKKEYFLWYNNSIKKFERYLYVNPLQRILEKHIQKKRDKHINTNISSIKNYKGNIKKD